MSKSHVNMCRRITELTDQEVTALCVEMFHPDKILDIEREDDVIRVTIVTTWPSGPLEDIVTLDESEYDVDWQIEPEDTWQYRQYLYALGVNPLSRDNPYLK